MECGVGMELDYVIVRDGGKVKDGEPLEVHVTLADGRIAITPIEDGKVKPHDDIPSALIKSIQKKLKDS